MSAGPESRGTVGKAVDLLDLMAATGRPVRFSELCAGSGLPKSTVSRLLHTLARERMVAYNGDSRTYSPGVRLLRLAHSAWKTTSLASVAEPFLDTLASRVGETIHLAQLDNGQVLYIDKRVANEPIEMFSQAGKVGPAHCTGVGKAMLAFLAEPQRSRAVEQQSFFAYTGNTLTSREQLLTELDRIRCRGIAFDRQEHEAGIICIATPIRAHARVIGALSITSSIQRHDLDSLLAFRPLLEDSAVGIGAAAGDWQFPGRTRQQT
ncbi:MAG: IclR family transcriptional regulator [Paracoccaceae bacterium]|nr:IclR family transcriptional regulator [Paracoccaceae bacterium]